MTNKRSLFFRAIVLLSCAALLFAATHNQGSTTYLGIQNFSGASSTFPMVVTPSAPGTCSLGQYYFNSSNGNTYACTAANSWSVISASGITALTGDVTAGPGSGSQAATLAATGVTAGSYTSTNLTVNAKGLVTAASNGSSGGGQILSTGLIFQPPNYPGYGSPTASDPTPTASQSNGMVVYAMQNSFASLTIGHAVLSGYTATGYVTIGIYNSSCSLVQQSTTVASVAGTNPETLAFATPAVITTPFYYLGMSFNSTGAAVVVQNGNNANNLVSALGTASGAGSKSIVYSTANGSTGSSTMTMPSTCGILTALTGMNSELPVLWFSNN